MTFGAAGHNMKIAPMVIGHSLMKALGGSRSWAGDRFCRFRLPGRRQRAEYRRRQRRHAEWLCQSSELLGANWWPT